MWPSLLVDKNVVERLAALPKAEYDEVLRTLSTKFQLVFPWVLIEEIWVNVGEPRGKNAAVIAGMVDIVSTRKGCWMEEETEQMFQELVIHKGTPKKLLPISDVAYEEICKLGPGKPGFQEFLTFRESTKAEMIRQRRELQDRLAARGSFIQVESEREFIKLFKQYYQNTNPNDVNALGYLVDAAKLLKARPQHRAFTKRIKRGFSSFLRNPKRYFITTSFLIAHLFYAYLPVYRIRDGTRHGQAILDRGDQKNNPEDQRYAACALICNHLVSGDRDLVKVLKCIKACGLWNGEVFEIEPEPNPISAQLLALVAR